MYMEELIIIETIIKLEDKIKVVLSEYPETKAVFLYSGLEKYIDDEFLKQFGDFLTLKTILKTNKINVDIFIQQLNEKINEKHKENYEGKHSDETKKLNMLALLPCPLKVPIEEKFNSFYKELKLNEKLNFNFMIDGNANKQVSYYDHIDEFESIEEVPDIIISPGINRFFYKNFVDKFINKGFFMDKADYEPNVINKINFKDPDGNYTMISMNLLIMVVDLTRIKDLPIPESFEDILKLEYYKSVAIRGKNGSFCETTLLTIFKEHGYEGIKRLASSVKYGWHPSQMVKNIGTGKEETPAISVMPYFYAKTITKKDKIKIVWPKDGAIVSPVFMLVKKTEDELINKAADFFAGKEVAQISADAFFPSLHPEANNRIPLEATFNWVGWDYIKSRDMETLIYDISELFCKEFEK